MQVSTNLHHLQELYSSYYPGSASKLPNPPQKAFSPEIFPKSTPLKILSRSCCGEKFTDQSNYLVHYFHFHFKYVHAALYKQPFRYEPGYLGNLKVPILYRVQLFLNSLKHIPENPCHFRPGPPSKLPQHFKNPYSRAMAMAYDFLEVVVNSPMEYLKFTFMLRAYHPVVDFKEIWPYWATYRYPEMNVLV